MGKLSGKLFEIFRGHGALVTHQILNHAINGILQLVRVRL